MDQLFIKLESDCLNSTLGLRCPGETGMAIDISIGGIDCNAKAWELLGKQNSLKKFESYFVEMIEKNIQTAVRIEVN